MNLQFWSSFILFYYHPHATSSACAFVQKYPVAYILIVLTRLQVIIRDINSNHVTEHKMPNYTHSVLTHDVHPHTSSITYSQHIKLSQSCPNKKEAVAAEKPNFLLNGRKWFIIFLSIRYVHVRMFDFMLKNKIKHTLSLLQTVHHFHRYATLWTGHFSSAFVIPW